MQTPGRAPVIGGGPVEADKTCAPIVAAHLNSCSMPQRDSAYRSCPVCESRQTRIYETRPTQGADDTTVLRRVKCCDCNSRWATMETFSHLISVEGTRVSRKAQPLGGGNLMDDSAGAFFFGKGRGPFIPGDGK